MSVAQSLRRSTARMILATPPLRKAFLRVALDEEMLVRLLEDPIFIYRVLHVKPVTGRLANVLDNPQIFEHFLASNRVHDRVLEDETFHGRLAEEDALLVGIARRKGLLKTLLQDSASLAEALATPRVLEAVTEFIAADNETLKRVLIGHGLVERLTADNDVLDRLASDDNFMAAVMKRAPAIPAAANSEAVRNFLARLPSRAEELSRDPRFLRELMKHESAAAFVTSDDDILARLIANERVVRRFATDPIALNTILAQPRARDAVLADARLLGAILQDDRAITQLLHDAPLLNRLIGRIEIINALFMNAQAVRIVFEDQRAIDAILSNEGLLHRILPRGKALAAFANDEGFVSQLTESPALVDRVLQRKPDARLAKKLEALVAFDDAWRSLMPFAAQTTELSQRAAAARAQLADSAEVPTAILGLLCEADRIHLPGATMEFPDRRSLWVLLHEILVEEEYYFETRSTAPRILDCGSHFGLAIYYFKRLFPEARITAFEPLPRMFEMAKRNIEHNAFSSVELLPFALSEKDGEATFHISEMDSMAGSLTERRRALGDHLVPVTVPCRKLSAWLDEPVHFLKLDIEGSEDVVLAEAAPKLGNVQHVFCEYHHGEGLDAARLPGLLELLAGAGFDVHLGKSFSYHEATRERPMKHVGRPYSLGIWARNRNWS